MEDYNLSPAVDLKNGCFRQIISTTDGEEFGYWITKACWHWLVPHEERIVLPDVEKGYEPPTDAMLKGKKGWIDFKVFKDFESAESYIKENIQELVDMFNNGDWD